ncbi:hypothetical protein [Bacillus altitudinis]|nr:hypothetical protein [Bacillus altitudinis]MEE3649091.1 hypothetical protein [Bacillus altitudinis]
MAGKSGVAEANTRAQHVAGKRWPQLKQIPGRSTWPGKDGRS